MTETVRKKLLVGVVGPCGAGKSTLVIGLQKNNLPARHIAQEHSYVPDMWQQLTNPDVLIFLDASYEVATTRLKLNWTEPEYLEQIRRLEHARKHASFYLQTDELTPQQVLMKVMEFLESYL